LFWLCDQTLSNIQSGTLWKNLLLDLEMIFGDAASGEIKMLPDGKEKLNIWKNSRRVKDIGQKIWEVPM
jgi:hypothetical protein